MSICQEEMPECPLCMETFDVDDLSFFPCTCGYQICRFCWHRIRTDEIGLCPACRKPYPEDPAHFKPLTDDEVHNIKKDRRLKEIQRKQKSAENRKHLSNVRVIQKNLVFVVGLSQRLADPEVLRKHEYFGKFGKIHKVVINQSTSYIGSQGPSASAYVTYLRTEDALHAIGVVNNLQVDNRTLKASLGTTKYCSHFLKGTQCTKTDCMYLHDLGDDAASFSKEDIQQGKHLIYEQKLIDQYSISNASTSENNIKLNNKSKSPSPPNLPELSPNQLSLSGEGSSGSNSESPTPPLINPNTLLIPSLLNTDFPNPASIMRKRNLEEEEGGINIVINESVPPSLPSPFPARITPEICNNKESEHSDDDLGFDPWDICSKGLADMMEKEKNMYQKLPLMMNTNNTHLNYLGKHSTVPTPAGTISNGLLNRSLPSYWPTNGLLRSKPAHMLLNDLSSQSKLLHLLDPQRLNEQQQQHLFTLQQNDSKQNDSRQENFKALLPNINISFSPNAGTRPQTQMQDLRRPFFPRQNYLQNGFTDLQHNFGWSMSNNSSSHNGSSNGIVSDPAIISTGIITDGNDTPHWMESIHKLTEESSQLTAAQIHQFQGLNGYANNIYNNAFMTTTSPLHAATSRMPPPGFNNYAGINPFVGRQQPVDGQHEMPTI